MTRMWSRPRPQGQGQGHNPQGRGRHFVASGQGLTSLHITIWDTCVYRTGRYNLLSCRPAASFRCTISCVSAVKLSELLQTAAVCIPRTKCWPINFICWQTWTQWLSCHQTDTSPLLSSPCSSSSHGHPQDFSRGGQIRGLDTKVHQQGPGVERRSGSGANPPEADEKLWK